MKSNIQNTLIINCIGKLLVADCCYTCVHLKVRVRMFFIALKSSKYLHNVINIYDKEGVIYVRYRKHLNVKWLFKTNTSGHKILFTKIYKQ